jgi:hypothetical protein
MRLFLELRKESLSNDAWPEIMGDFAHEYL